MFSFPYGIAARMRTVSEQDGTDKMSLGIGREHDRRLQKRSLHLAYERLQNSMHI